MFADLMRKRSAFFLFSFLLVMILAYSGWCARAFWMPGRLSFDATVPEVERSRIRGFVREREDLNRPFEWAAFAWSLAHPFEAEGNPPVLVRRRMIETPEGMVDGLTIWLDAPGPYPGRVARMELPVVF